MAIIRGYGQTLGSWAYSSEFNMLNKWLEINQIQLGYIMEYTWEAKTMGEDGLAC